MLLKKWPTTRFAGHFFVPSPCVSIGFLGIKKEVPSLPCLLLHFKTKSLIPHHILGYLTILDISRKDNNA